MERFNENGATIVRYTEEEAKKLPVLIHLKRATPMTDEEIEAAALSDPEARPFTDEDIASGRVRRLHVPQIDGLSFAERVRMAQKAGKKLVSVRYDEDVIAWYRQQGKGYQTLMNNVLRAYMESQTR